MNYYDPETAPETNGTCPIHNEVLILAGRMTLDGPLEYVCPTCMGVEDDDAYYDVDTQDAAEAEAYAAQYD